MAPRWLAVRQTLSREAKNAGLTMFERVLLFDLASGAQVGQVPGLFLFSLALAAEDLGVTVRGTEKGMARLVETGFVRYDRTARVVWREAGAIDFLGQVRTPMQIRSWSKAWAAIPDCPLKRTAAERLFAMVREKGTAFAEECAKVFGVYSGSDSGSNPVSDSGSDSGSNQGSAFTLTLDPHPHPEPSPEPGSPQGSPSKPSPTTTPEPTKAEAARGESHEEIQPESESGETRQEIHEEDPPRAAPPPKPRKTGELAAVRKLVAHLGDPMLASRLRDAWCGGADLDIAVELYLAQLADQTGLRSPGAWLLAQVRRLHDDPDALEAFREQADEIRAERVRTAEREADRQRREAEREEREREAERQATERRAALEAEWAELYAKNALPGEPRAAFAWRVQDAQHSHDPRGFLVLQYQSATGRTMREAHADAAARGLSTELPASFPIRPARVA